MPIGIHRRNLTLLAGLVLVGLCGTTAARAADSQYFGRWTVSDDKPVYTAKGRHWKTFDVARCGADFCGVAVDDKQNCGETLFRFLTIHAGNDELVGHGLWGSEKKKLMIDFIKTEGSPDSLYLGVGNSDMDLSAREGSMAIFEANYKRLSGATCVVSTS